MRAAAFNGLNYVSAFKAAFAEQNLKERVSIEHMETFFFIFTAHEQEGIELRRLQKALNYAQAKMHRTAATLETLGWIDIVTSAEDARQKEVQFTDSGYNFFVKISKSLSSENNGSVFEATSRRMRDEIQEQAQLRAAIHNLNAEDIGGTSFDEDEAQQLNTLIAQTNEQKVHWQKQLDITEEEKSKVKAKSKEAMRLNIISELQKSLMQETHDELSLQNRLFKDPDVSKAESDGIMRQWLKRNKSHSETRRIMRDILMERGEKTVEVGEKYIKTVRGIVTFPVLFKRTSCYNLAELGAELSQMDSVQFDQVLTPKPKTKIDRLKSELNSVMAYGWGAIEGNPHLFQRVHVLQSEIAALEAKLGQGIGSLQDNPVTKDAWQAAMDSAADKHKNSEQPKLSRGLLDPDLYKQYKEDEAEMDAAVEARANQDDAGNNS